MKFKIGVSILCSSVLDFIIFYHDESVNGRWTLVNKDKTTQKQLKEITIADIGITDWQLNSD